MTRPRLCVSSRASPQAADENAVSRIYVGFHFRDAVETGTRHGERIADRAVNRFLRPAREGARD